ncbi:phosphoribosylaminoimidazolesuccinocarboxamide synthase [bacterium]|nr:phosphoribosylaminoimidazolesuccinocarboxamide synthase [bacterium]MBU1071770.1 phosphoribosylaminoimidazolesuccinocarboxamide synthase [bacterium]MBU1674685.1 phosphoribosylaminoimidazolesuccinocarboxamide synthase [bacterium]
MQSLRSTVDLGLQPDRTGKVREIFDLGDELLIVATDRISAYDVVMNQGIPGRGCVLTVMTLAWLDYFNEIPNHLVTAEADLFPAPFRELRAELAGRAMLVRKAEPFPVECIARGYITGSGWRSYQRDGTICGHALPAGLLKSQQLPRPLFTPSTKAATGHDENIVLDRMSALIGAEPTAELASLTLDLYTRAAAYGKAGGVLIADTKFEFGTIDGQVTLIDEVLTPDSSRFWPASEHVPGEEPSSWDKQILRNHLDTLDWNREAPPPVLPEEILERTSRRYLEVLDILFAAEARRWHAILK